jgi:ArsR family transcriptional regulator
MDTPQAADPPQPRILSDQDFAHQIADILKALAHPLRIRIVAMLCQGPLHVNALARRLEVKQSVVSQQLRILRMNNLVQVTRDGGFGYYSLAEPSLVNLVSCMESCRVN